MERLGNLTIPDGLDIDGHDLEALTERQASLNLRPNSSIPGGWERHFCHLLGHVASRVTPLSKPGGRRSCPLELRLVHNVASVGFHYAAMRIFV
jgi:hypothetical protein